MGRVEVVVVVVHLARVEVVLPSSPVSCRNWASRRSGEGRASSRTREELCSNRLEVEVTPFSRSLAIFVGEDSANDTELNFKHQSGNVQSFKELHTLTTRTSCHRPSFHFFLYRLFPAPSSSALPISLPWCPLLSRR